MTRGLGRQDPDGLLVALRHGAADRHARQVRRRLRQRHRRRPPRHRDALERPDESQSLPGRRHLLSVRATVRIGAPTRGRQDHRQQRHHRPRRRKARPQAGRSRRSGSNGSSMACSTARLASPARRARARRSCGATERYGPPTRTASFWACWPPRSRRAPGATRASCSTARPASWACRSTSAIDAPATPSRRAC